ncbi:queuosine salvage family protein [Noviherbaspirillum aridicola]|uniref:Queuosine salvage protein n=1 Tax=Noviherbaspirillum aridicola TaxID=2849687 RepID=A0ABQ4PZL7_9BURK|nr:queuosine salvage family protein [Noviherbaspirillum aridicola]GIZ50337.1 hypothetical protein NCCP691_03510 [Noviherbaspirillum aridicola]
MPSAKQQLLDQARADYQPELVRFDEDVISRLPARGDRFSHMTSGLFGKPAGSSPESAAAYCIALNSLNFMFWQPEPDGFSRYHWNGSGGAHGLAAAFDHAWGELQGPERLRDLLGTGDEQAVLSAFGQISLPRRRGQFLREVLQDRQLEEAASELVAAGRSGRMSSDDAQRLAQRFPMAFGQDAYLMRAQLALMWYAGYLMEQGSGVDCDITVAASYQMPRVMRSIRVLRFAPALAEMIDKHVLILRNSPEERAIRSATVLGAQAMALHLGVSEHAMVNVLWHNRHASGSIPYHLTVTTDY